MKLTLVVIVFALALWLFTMLSVTHDAIPEPVETVATSSTTATTAPPTTTTTIVVPPTTTPRVVARSAPMAPSKRPDVVAVIRAGFARFGPVVAEQAVRVASCETGGTFNPNATNGAHAGLFQISGTYHRARVARLGFTWPQMFEAAPNVAVAADIYKDSGWGPWTCRYAA